MAPSGKISLVLLIAIATVISYLDRSAIAYALVPLETRFGLDSTQYGLILGAFGIGYLLMIVSVGRLVDRFGASTTWAVSALLWSICAMALSLGRGFWSFFILRLLLGFFEGIHFPAMQKAIHDWLPAAWRARALSISLTGVPIATFIGAPLMTFLIQRLGWQAMFIIIGSLGIFWAAAWWKKTSFQETPSASRLEPVPWKQLFKNRDFLIACFHFFSFGYIVFFILLWLPGYLEKELHLNLQQTGLWIMLPWAVSAVLLLAGGWVSDALQTKGGSSRLSRCLPIGFGFFIAAISFWGLTFVDSMQSAIAWISLGLGFAFFINSPLYAINADLFGAQIGRVQSTISGFFALSGIVAPSLTGLFITLFGSFQAAIYCVAALSLIAALLSVFAQKK